MILVFIEVDVLLKQINNFLSPLMISNSVLIYLEFDNLFN